MKIIHPAVKHQLILLSLLLGYLVIRLVGVANLPLTIWEQIYWGNIIKNSFGLVLLGVLWMIVLKTIRQNQVSGPQIIAGKRLKRIAYFAMALFWLAVVTHTIFDSIKIALPLTELSIYKFADLMDETISHIFMYVPAIILFFVIAFLEIERPFVRTITIKNGWLLGIINFTLGALMGLNFTEGNLSFYTSFPLVILLAFSLIYLSLKHRLSLRQRPWTLSIMVGTLGSSLSFATWVMIFPTIPQFFSTF